MNKQNRLSIQEAAERLGVRTDYVRELVQKKRLDFIEGEQLDVVQVENLAQLLNKLRASGISSLVEITAQGNKIH